jgi:hypothetical protein
LNFFTGVKIVNISSVLQQKKRQQGWRSVALVQDRLGRIYGTITDPIVISVFY